MTSNNSNTSTKPLSETCRVCRAPIEPGADVCERCGSTQGDEHKCPFCGAVAAPRPSSTFRYACPVCGAPRVPTPGGDAALPDEAIEKLREAKSSYSSKLAWKISSLVMFAFGLIALFLLTGVAVVASPPMFALGLGAAVNAMPMLFAILAWNNAKKRNAQMLEALDQSWVLSAIGLLERQGPMTMSMLQTRLKLTEEQSKTVMAALGANSAVQTRMTSDGQLEYSAITVSSSHESEEDLLAKQIDALAGESGQSEEDLLAKQIDALDHETSAESTGKTRVASDKDTSTQRDEQLRRDEQALLEEALAEAEEEQERASEQTR